MALDYTPTEADRVAVLTAYRHRRHLGDSPWQAMRNVRMEMADLHTDWCTDGPHDQHLVERYGRRYRAASDYVDMINQRERVGQIRPAFWRHGMRGVAS